MLLTRLAGHALYRSDLPHPYYRNRTIRWAIRITPDGRAHGAGARRPVRRRPARRAAAGRPVCLPLRAASPGGVLAGALRYVVAAQAVDPERARPGWKPKRAAHAASAMSGTRGLVGGVRVPGEVTSGARMGGVAEKYGRWDSRFGAPFRGGRHLRFPLFPLRGHDRTDPSGTHRPMRSLATRRHTSRPVLGIGMPKLWA